VPFIAFISFVVLACSVGTAYAGSDAAPPTVPVGVDAYRHWDRWPVQRIGARAYMRSTYDRAGGNEGADASHFLYQLAYNRNVALDVAGPGMLYFVRYNHWHGSPWHYVIDGTDTVVTESATKDPNHPPAKSVFQPAGAFPAPLALTWATTKGADLSWVPIGFEKSFRMDYSRTHYGTGYFIFDRYVPGAKLSRPIVAWKPASPIDAEVLKLIASAGGELVAPTIHRTVALPARGSATVYETSDGPRQIRALTFSVPEASAIDFGRARLRITWDDRAEPSVDATVALFFGAGTLYNRDGRQWLVKAFPVNIHFIDSRVQLACYFPMPFFKSAKIELIGQGTPVDDVQCGLATQALAASPHDVGYFHATYHDFSKPKRGHDLVLLDTRGVEGSRDWTGSFIGTSFIFSHNANLTTLEGDPRFYFDDSQTPQAQGTGTEEWGGGGDYWGGQNMTLPFAGHPCGARSVKEAKSEEDKIESAYRFLLADLFPFGRNARICLEHGGTDESTEHYETVAYWYGLPGASLIPTDSLNIADSSSERAHDYRSPEASAADRITSRFERGVDHLGGEEMYPAHTETGRTTTGQSEFTLKLDPENWGVLLRRTLDYSFANQRAEVFVADADAKDPKWEPAGVWYTAGSSTCVYSNPKDELGKAQHIVQTSNRRFRDDEFLIGRDLTRGRSRIRVRIRFTPVKTPPFPGHQLPPLAWSEIRYDAYCFVLPQAEVK
jgi:hypothetical protein